MIEARYGRDYRLDYSCHDPPIHVPTALSLACACRRGGGGAKTFHFTVRYLVPDLDSKLPPISNVLSWLQNYRIVSFNPSFPGIRLAMLNCPPI